MGNSKEEQNESMITCSSGFVMSMHGKEAECNRVMFYNVQSTSYNFFAFCFKWLCLIKLQAGDVYVYT